MPSARDALSFLSRADFVWYQRFELAPGVTTPGASDIGRLFRLAQIPDDLSGLSALDIGTTNGGAAFELERRGARPVIAVDIEPPARYGFDGLASLLGSGVRYVRASIYELPQIVRGQFDIVLFWGVLYHLRHPLLALDNLRLLTAGEASIETAVADFELDTLRSLPLVRFYRRRELADDSSNWFAPSIAALHDWCSSCGLETQLLAAWPDSAPNRCIVRVRPATGPPEYLRLSYELPLSCTVQRRRPMRTG